MRNTLLHLLLLFICLFAGSRSAFAADDGNKCGTPAAGHTYRYLMAYDTKAAAFARSRYGSLEAHAQVAIDRCNQVVHNSNIDAYFEIGDCIEMSDVTWTDGSSAGMSGAGQSLSERPDVRKAWLDSESHICAIVVYPGNNSLSGNFTLEPLSWDRACGVMDAGALIDTYTLIHETGHIFGCHHDEVYTSDKHAYALGYVGNGYYTVMSYGHMAGGTIAMAPYFSGPDQVYNGVTLGDAKHNNARMFREHLPIVDQFLTRKPVVIITETTESATGTQETYLLNNTKIINNYNAQYKYFTLKMLATGGFSFSSSASWLKVTAAPSSSYLGYAITVDYEQNTTNAPREAVITIQGITDPDFVEYVYVKQNCQYGVIASETEFTVPSEAQNLSVDFATEGSGTLKSDCDWITINGASSCTINNGSNVTFQVAANTTGQQRVGTLQAYRNTSRPTVITVTQTAAGLGFVDFPDEPIAFDSRKQVRQISFYAGQAFTITSPEWITCTKSAETGYVKVNINVSANTDASAKRQDTITFTSADGKDVHTISVSQTPNTSYVVDVTDWKPNCRAQNKLVHLTTATNWTARIDEDNEGTITVSPTSGTGNATLNIRITENAGGKPRYAKVIIEGDDSCDPVKVLIEQAGYDSNAVAPDPEVEEGGKDPVVDPDPNPGTGGSGGDDKDPETGDGVQTYTIRLDHAGTVLYLTTTEVADNKNYTYSLSTEPEEFYIVSADKGYTLQSATTKKYVGYTGANGWDCFDSADAWTIASIEGVSTTILKDDKVGLGADDAEDKAGVFTNKPDADHPNAVFHWIISPAKGEPTTPVEPETKPCATPVVSFNDGTLAVSCATPDATFRYVLTAASQQFDGTGSSLSSTLSSRTFTLTVTADAKGFTTSQPATLTLSLEQVAQFVGLGTDVNADGKTDAADVETLVQKVLRSTINARK